MSDIEPKQPYVYQPFGVKDNDGKAIYGVGGVGPYAQITGLTKLDAELIASVLTVPELPQEDKDNE